MSKLPHSLNDAVEELVDVFVGYESAPQDFKIGAESEKFGLVGEELTPLRYGEPPTVSRVLQALHRDHGWECVRDLKDGPVLALKREGASITLEPSVQLELSGAPHETLHGVWEEQRQHLEELRPISEEMSLQWITLGFHPFATLSELDWVPKLRYPIMRDYLPAQGSGGLDMMQRTATVQVNLDWSTEVDCARKLRVAQRSAALIQAAFANSPFEQGQEWSGLSRRGEVWRHMDPRRSGMIRPLWEQGGGYADYIRWAAQAGMFLFRRDGRAVKNTGQSFVDFLENGYQGFQATREDFELHLSTLFPEIRLKNTIEVRPNDGLNPSLAMSVVALWTGLLYDEEATKKADDLLEPLQFDEVQEARAEMVRSGPLAQLGGRDGWDWLEDLATIARGGLKARGCRSTSASRSAAVDESIYLGPAEEIIDRRQTPAELLKQRIAAAPAELSWRQKVARCASIDWEQETAQFN
ncbi:MAG: glutamate-cysteine ligase family protein [Polyangiaceae bacterium]|nr:glutamate-cysteine ligase family protein [Polyangiaceae bacterium]